MARGKSIWHLKKQAGGYATLTLDVPGQAQNTLGRAVLDQFEAFLEEIEKNPPKALFVRSGKESGFMAGADIEELGSSDADSLKALIDQGHKALNRLEALPCPTVAVIHGVCLGGGLEVALACDHRVADHSARFGFPEVQLGLHPGLGGTERLPRVVEPATALQLMLTGKTIDARKAKKLGLVRDAVPDRHLLAAARAAAETGKQKRKRGLLDELKYTLEFSSPGKRFIANRARKETAKHFSEKHYPAPYALIDLFEQETGSDDALEAEAQSFVKLSQTETAKNLIGLFLRREALKREARRSKGHDISHVHIIGAGTMGADIAMWTAMNGFTVTLQDIDRSVIAKAIGRAHKWMDGKPDHSDDVRDPEDRLIADPKGDGVRSADLIIEAGPEKAEIKQKIYDGLKDKLKSRAIIATNTSSIRLETLAEGLPGPNAGRFVGLHFFNPVTKMPLVEIVSGEKTTKETQARALAFIEAIAKLPLPVKSAPGFLVNRILTPYLLQAVKLIDEGCSPEEVDAAAEDFGMQQGPVEVADTVGLDICLEVGRVLARDLDHVADPPAQLIEKVEAGDLGKKTGKGFYTWSDGKPQKAENEAGPKTLEKLQERLLAPLYEEVRRVLDEGIVASEDHLDLGAVFGSGFAPFRGGPCTALRQKKAAPSSPPETPAKPEEPAKADMSEEPKEA
ncbi:3-hydroxyacyl-CoA dehydrogenase NAD-binding domain-containing protein [Henriciella aquimarina]|uniref:3-hydroxyacyl-CoA dehydrogenase NAD-binding domain-containing protein n=1 Tax=Henriciella aquimarina TaxID=545261 RepID=UPI0009FDEFF3|nr:3-hydroxyacyl-CoA dehydrogenase NAD-binding domain-containing protein [Henriciella aquimarina]